MALKAPSGWKHGYETGLFFPIGFLWNFAFTKVYVPFHLAFLAYPVHSIAPCLTYTNGSVIMGIGKNSSVTSIGNLVFILYGVFLVLDYTSSF